MTGKVALQRKSINCWIVCIKFDGNAYKKQFLCFLRAIIRVLLPRFLLNCDKSGQWVESK